MNTMAWNFSLRHFTIQLDVVLYTSFFIPLSLVDPFFNTFYFAVTLDYKALLLLLRKKDDEEYVLGCKGYDTEFCAYCDAIRVNIVTLFCSYFYTRPGPGYM